MDLLCRMCAGAASIHPRSLGDGPGRAEISWIYPPRFPKMENNIKIKTYIKCIHRPAYAYDRPHLNPSTHLFSSAFISMHLPLFPSFSITYFHLPLCAFICYHLPSSSFISHHLALFATIWINLLLFPFI